jgi:hypothetical protein
MPSFLFDMPLLYILSELFSWLVFTIGVLKSLCDYLSGVSYYFRTRSSLTCIILSYSLITSIHLYFSSLYFYFLSFNIVIYISLVLISLFSELILSSSSFYTSIILSNSDSFSVFCWSDSVSLSKSLRILSLSCSFERTFSSYLSNIATRSCSTWFRSLSRFDVSISC